MKILVTGAAGFIGMHVALALLRRGDDVVGFDNLNDYYDPALKRARLEQLSACAGFRFVQEDVNRMEALEALFTHERIDRVVHLAAQAGVRYSLLNPHAYAQSNLVGFVNILEACRKHSVEHLVYASSSSVYGSNLKMPFAEDDNVDHPVSLYAATKKANELMAYTYSHLYRLPATGLRFFTVYGPWGRPDMAIFKFTRAVLAGEPIDVYNHGEMRRDFTYIDDAVEAVCLVLDRPPHAIAAEATADAGSAASHRILNVGNHEAVRLMEFIEAIERASGRSAVKRFLPMQPGEVQATYAAVQRLEELIGVRPRTPIGVGVERFVSWYRAYAAAPPNAAR